MTFSPRRIEDLIAQTGTQRLITREEAGPTHRERYRLPCGRTLDVTRQRDGDLDTIIAFAICAHLPLRWQVDLEGVLHAGDR